MESAIKLFMVLPGLDWAALIWFGVAWVGYTLFAQRRARHQPSVLAATNRIRREWMRQATFREVRVLDGVVVQNLSSSPSFFASTTILIIGGLLAVIGTTERANELVREIPFAAQTSVLVFDLKVLLLLAIFIDAFFRFTWSMRQYTFGALLVAAAPEREHFVGDDAARERFADQAGRVVGLAAENFNAGVRAYYMAFAVIAWLFSPLAFMVGTALVITVLYQHEFRSEVLAVLLERDR